MRALTLRQPWAWCIALDEIPLVDGTNERRAAAGHRIIVPKRIENRDKRPPAYMVGQHFAIHAGLRVEKSYVASLRADGILVPDDLIVGAVVAVARLRGTSTSEPTAESDQWFWWTNAVTWVLDDVRILAEPVPAKGKQQHGWLLPRDVAGLVIDRAVWTGGGSGASAKSRTCDRLLASPPPQGRQTYEGDKR